MDGGLLAFVICLLFFMVVYGIRDYKIAKHRREYEEKTNALKAFMEVNNGVMKLKERNPKLKDIIGIVPATRGTINYSPEKIHFGSATVGGVTTGGVYKTGGYSAGKDVTVDGKYQLMHFGKVIEKIELSYKLKETARKSSIKDYLDDSGDIIVNRQVMYSDYARIAMQSGNPEPGMIERTRGFPSKEKAQAILDWITCERK